MSIWHTCFGKTKHLQAWQLTEHWQVEPLNLQWLGETSKGVMQQINKKKTISKYYSSVI
jgi:hypothetical protein